MKETFAGKARAAALGMRPEGFTAEDLSERMGLQTYQERDVLRRTIKDMVARGEIERLGSGRLAYRGRPSGQRPQKRSVMWRYLRSSRSFGGVTVQELMEVAGATDNYVREWLLLLDRLEVVAQQPGGRWQLVRDPVEMPVDDRKAAKLRALRAKRKDRIVKELERARSAISKAIDFVRGEE